MSLHVAAIAQLPLRCPDLPCYTQLTPHRAWREMQRDITSRIAIFQARALVRATNQPWDMCCESFAASLVSMILSVDSVPPSRPPSQRMSGWKAVRAWRLIIRAGQRETSLHDLLQQPTVDFYAFPPSEGDKGGCWDPRASRCASVAPTYPSAKTTCRKFGSRNPALAIRCGFVYGQ